MRLRDIQVSSLKQESLYQRITMETVKLAYDVFELEDTRSDLNPIILTHGLFWNKFMFKDLATDLCKETKRKVYSLDLRNHGESPFSEDFTSNSIIEDIRRFLKERDLKRVCFVCHSFSSSFAYLIAVDQPEVVEKLVFIDHPTFAIFTQSFQLDSVTPQVRIQNRLLNGLNPQMTLQEAKNKFYELAKMGNRGQEFMFRKAAYDLTKEKGQFKWKTDLDFLLKRYLERKCSPKPRGSSQKEILIIRCANSTRIPDSKFEAVLKYNPNAKLITFEDTSHLLMFEKSKEFVEAVKGFLLSTNDILA
ncbi:hypothetical protein NPIL_554241 [Nephila pilipes]|uniref:sn-1-specific diacylglycerol lipase ABHD11 n=1 Tax=Nephila pilipes TaxID=299642 RepID=A0A8X6NPI8_NEPPI|nr:hypothetical protein NPIL_554241 [Nephila pilipes]